MARPVPPSPALKEAALDAALASAPTPALPPGMAARIIANATALPQRPPCPVVEPELAQSAKQTSAEIIPFALPAPKPPAPRRRLFAITALAALAASMATVLVVGPSDHQAIAPVAGRPPARLIAAAPAPVPESSPAAAPARLTAGRQQPTRADRATPPPQALAPEAPAAAQPEPQLATSGERTPAPATGPQSGPAAGPHVVPNGGMMGPPAPQQGWGISGGAPGSVTLPSQTAGATPPATSPGAGPVGGPGGSAGGSRGSGPGGHH